MKIWYDLNDPRGIVICYEEPKVEGATPLEVAPEDREDVCLLLQEFHTLVWSPDHNPCRFEDVQKEHEIWGALAALCVGGVL